MYARQTGVWIFLPLAVSVLAVLRTAHLPQVLYAIVGLDAVQMVDLLWKATVYKEEYQPVLPKFKPFSSEKYPDKDIAFALINHSGIFTVPLLINHLSCRCIIFVGRKQMLLKCLPLFLC